VHTTTTIPNPIPPLFPLFDDNIHVLTSTFYGITASGHQLLFEFDSFYIQITTRSSLSNRPLYPRCLPKSPLQRIYYHILSATSSSYGSSQLNWWMTSRSVSYSQTTTGSSALSSSLKVLVAKNGIPGEKLWPSGGLGDV
jgi:hypothetical protein